jgi:hypothetical protein
VLSRHARAIYVSETVSSGFVFSYLVEIEDIC